MKLILKGFGFAGWIFIATSLLMFIGSFLNYLSKQYFDCQSHPAH